MKILEEISPIASGSPPLRFIDASSRRFQFSKWSRATEGQLQSQLPLPKLPQSKYHFKIPLKRNVLGFKQSFETATPKIRF